MPRAPILFTVYANADDDLFAVRNTDHGLTDQFLDFLSRLIFFCNSTTGPANSGTRSDFVQWLDARNLPASPVVFTRHVQGTLTKAGCIEKRRTVLAGVRYEEYRIKDLQNLITLGKETQLHKKAILKRGSEIQAQTREQARELAAQQELLTTTDLTVPTQITLIQTLAVVFRRSVNGVNQGTVRYRFRPDEYLEIGVAGFEQTGTVATAVQKDRALLRVLVSMVREELKAKTPDLSNRLENTYEVERELMAELSLSLNRPFYFDLRDLARRMSGNTNSSTLRSVAAALYRLRSTRIFVNASESPTWRKLFHKHGDSTQSEYDIITELEGKDIRWNPGDRNTNPPRFVVVKFHTQIMASLLMDRHVFVGHKALTTDKSGLAQALNDWQRGFIGVKNDGKGNRTHEFTLKSLNTAVFGFKELRRGRPSPVYEEGNFQRDFLKVMERSVLKPGQFDVPDYARGTSWSTEEGSIVRCWFYGYFYTLEFDQDLAIEIDKRRQVRPPVNREVYPAIFIERDTEDELTGNDNNRNRLARQRQQAALPPTQPDDDLLTVKGWAESSRLEALEATVSESLDILGREDFRPGLEGFFEHHTPLGEARTGAQWETLLKGWFKNRAERPSLRNTSPSRSTRAIPLEEQLTDTSWAKQER